MTALRSWERSRADVHAIDATGKIHAAGRGGGARGRVPVVGREMRARVVCDSTATEIKRIIGDQSDYWTYHGLWFKMSRSLQCQAKDRDRGAVVWTWHRNTEVVWLAKARRASCSTQSSRATDAAWSSSIGPTAQLDRASYLGCAKRRGRRRPCRRGGA
jgi:hypothetical protein